MIDDVLTKTVTTVRERDDTKMRANPQLEQKKSKKKKNREKKQEPKKPPLSLALKRRTLRQNNTR